MKIAIIGAAGKSGRLIAAEAKARGHEVTAIVRPERAAEVEAPVLAKALMDLTIDDLKGFDAVVNTVAARKGVESVYLDETNYLIDLFKSLPEVRLLVIGGAGSLNKADGSGKVIDDIPEAFRSCPAAQKESLEYYRASDINWTFISPAGFFDPDGVRSGSYTLGDDTQIFNRVGESYISYADFAIALVDEIEQNRHPRKRFTAVSCDPFFRNAKQYFPVDQYMFSRAGAWIALSIDNVKYGAGALYLTTNRGMRSHNKAIGVNLFRIYPTHDGHRVPFAVQSMSASELALHTRYGDVRFTFADTAKLMAEGDPGMGLLWTRRCETYEQIKPRRDGAWESVQRASGSLCFKGLEGSSFTFGDTWNWYDLHCGTAEGRTIPGPDGRFCMVCEEFDYAAKVRGSYPTYAEAKADMQADWEAFLGRMPHYIQPYEQKREESAYVLWTHLVAPTATAPNWMIMMFPGEMASAWQLLQNGVALQEQGEISRSLILAPLQRQSEDGQLADGYDEAFLSTGGYKPNIYGFGLKNLMKHHDLGKEWSREELEALYTGAGRWADWFMAYRDDDGDGLPGYEGGTENGFDEVTAYWDTLTLATPDLCAQEVLNFEAVGDLAKLLGRDDEAAEWYRKSTGLLNRMIEKMWDGEHFVALRPYTHEPVFSGSNMHYVPLVLGRRLPQHIIDKMTADLLVEGKLLSPYGLASENMDSDVFEVSGVKMGCGPISPPGQLFILAGLWEAGKKQEAKMIIDRYLCRLMDGGFSHFINPVSGDGSAFWGTWCRCVFTILARLVSEG